MQTNKRKMSNLNTSLQTKLHDDCNTEMWQIVLPDDCTKHILERDIYIYRMIAQKTRTGVW